MNNQDNQVRKNIDLLFKILMLGIDLNMEKMNKTVHKIKIDKERKLKPGISL